MVENVTDWSGNDLQYYPTNFEGCATSAANLVTTFAGEGQCGSFMFLMASALSLDGIAYQFTGAKPKDGSGMLINNWNFATAPQNGHDPTYKWNFTMVTESYGGPGMYPPPAGHLFGDLTSETGLPGQGTNAGFTTPSEKTFTSHYFVQLTDSNVVPPEGNVNSYFDPSYGAWYANQAAFETKSVAGYTSLAFPPPSSKARVVGGAVNVCFFVFPSGACI